MKCRMTNSACLTSLVQRGLWKPSAGNFDYASGYLADCIHSVGLLGYRFPAGKGLVWKKKSRFHYRKWLAQEALCLRE